MDCYFDYVTPAGLDPGAWVLFVEDFAVRVVDAVAVDVLVRHIQSILAFVRPILPNRKPHLPL